MAKSGSVWGLDLGQCALKALRCRAGDEPGTVVAEAFDYIEYPKMLGQPDANPAELMNEALTTFLSRNSVKGDRVAISVSGQSGLSRFIKLPPVETKKIPDIVKYEARQQIPFALEDVVWDYEQMAGGSVEEGFALETEVGLFAMKRDQVSRALRPFQEAGIEIDIVQLTPVALYNFVTFDQMPDTPPPEQYTPDDPPPSTIVMSLGADISDLVVSNGYRVWQRTVNLGGNHFTKALTKQMKLTFAKAEHLKRNAMKAEDPKAVFQAMRPVFGELLGEVQRSLSFFQNLDRTAKLGRVVPLGNAMKLRGLHKYLAQNLGLEVAELDGYRQLSGSAVTESPAFKDNMLSFGVCYGLCVQGLGLGKLSTNLLPKEIVKDRMIKAKKPFAVAIAALLLLGFMFGFLARWREWDSARESDAYKTAFSASKNAQDVANSTKESFTKSKADYDLVKGIGDRLMATGEKRLQWSELLKAINDCLPRDPPPVPGQPAKEIPLADLFSNSNVVYIDSIDCEYYPDLTAWIAAAKTQPGAAQPASSGQPDGAGSTPPADPAANPGAAPTAPAQNAPQPTAEVPGGASTDSGSGAAAAPDNRGWVIQLIGHHYHNKDKTNQGQYYVHTTLLKNLDDMQIQLVDPKGNPVMVSTKQLGIEAPVIVDTRSDIHTVTIPNPNVTGGAAAVSPLGAGAGPAAAQPGATGAQPSEVTLQQFDFKIEFAWKPTTPAQREAMRKAEEEKKKASEAEQPKVAGTDGTTPQNK